MDHCKQPESVHSPKTPGGPGASASASSGASVVVAPINGMRDGGNVAPPSLNARDDCVVGGKTDEGSQILPGNEMYDSQGIATGGAFVASPAATTATPAAILHAVPFPTSVTTPFAHVPTGLAPPSAPVPTSGVEGELACLAEFASLSAFRHTTQIAEIDILKQALEQLRNEFDRYVAKTNNQIRSLNAFIADELRKQHEPNLAGVQAKKRARDEGASMQDDESSEDSYGWEELQGDGDEGEDEDEEGAVHKISDCDSVEVLFQSKSILRCAVSEISPESSFFNKESYRSADAESRSRVMRTATSILENGTEALEFKDNRSSSSLDMWDDKNMCFLILYRKSVPISLCTFVITNQTSRSLVDLHTIHTVKRYRRNGHASLALSFLKEFVCNNPFKKNPDNIFIWSSADRRSRKFFLSRQQGWIEGWGTLDKFTDEVPEHYEGGTKCHITLDKRLRCEYVRAAREGRNNPIADKVTKRPRLAHWDSTSIYPVGSNVRVLYPNVKSTRSYDAMILDYNPTLPKPYCVRYKVGAKLDYVVPARICGKADEAGVQNKIVVDVEPMTTTATKLPSNSHSDTEGDSIPTHDLFKQLAPASLDK